MRENFSKKKWVGISQVKTWLWKYTPGGGKKAFAKTIKRKGVSQFEEQHRENGRTCGN